MKQKKFGTSVSRRITPDENQSYEDITTDNSCAVSGCEKSKSGDLIFYYIYLRRLMYKWLLKLFNKQMY